MQSLEYIDNYFKGTLSEQEIAQFEKRVLDDPAFAEEVAFYCNAMQVAKDELITERKQRFKEIYSQPKVTRRKNFSLVRSMRPFMAAAASVIAFALFLQPPLVTRMADKYIRERLQILSGPMAGATTDELERGKELYNRNRLHEAQQVFEDISQKDTASLDAKNFAGLVSLRLRQYDKAIKYFTELGNIVLRSNPGKFHHALTLMKRNQPGDKLRAKQLLQQVVDKKLAHYDVAGRWLERW